MCNLRMFYHVDFSELYNDIVDDFGKDAAEDFEEAFQIKKVNESSIKYQIPSQIEVFGSEYIWVRALAYIFLHNGLSYEDIVYIDCF